MVELSRQLRLLRAYGLLTYPFACVPFLWFYFADHGVTLAGYGELIAWYYLAMFVAELPTGMLADRCGRKPMLVLGPLLLATGFGTLWLWRSHLGFCLGEVVMGIGHAVLSGPASALLYDSLKERRQEHRFLAEEARLHGRRLLGTGAAFLLGGAVAWLCSSGGRWDFTATIPLTALLCLLGSALAVGLREPAVPRPAPREFLRGAAQDLRQRPVLWLLVYYVVLFALLRHPFHNYQVYLDEVAATHRWLGDPLVIGGLYAGLNLVAAPCSRQVPVLLERCGRRFLFWAMPVVLALSIVAMAAPGPWGVLLFVLQQVPFGMHWALVQDFVNHRIRPESRTTVLSALSLGGRMVFAGLSVLLFRLQDQGGHGQAFLAAGLGGLLLTVLVMLLRPRGLLRGQGVLPAP